MQRPHVIIHTSPYIPHIYSLQRLEDPWDICYRGPHPLMVTAGVNGSYIWDPHIFYCPPNWLHMDCF